MDESQLTLQAYPRPETSDNPKLMSTFTYSCVFTWPSGLATLPGRG